MRVLRHVTAMTGALVAALVTSPPVARLLEAQMSTHMLLQVPSLLLAGALLGTLLPGTARQASWNMAGVPMFLAASFVVMFWMTPIALDHAAASAGWDVAKFLTLLMAGACVSASWQRAPLVVQAFFVGNGIWMGVVVGVLLQAADRRLCNAYLMDDQVTTGVALTWISVAVATAWAMRLAASGEADQTEIKL